MLWWVVLKIFLSACVCIPFAKSQVDFLNSTTERSFTTYSISPPVKCGETQKMVDSCFKDLPPHLIEFLQSTKIAVNEQEIVSKCTVFKRGMRCFDRYTERCLSRDKIQFFQNNVSGARRFLAKFCDDRKFQSDYLKHKECFSHIQEEWKRCTNHFQRILSDEFNDINNPVNITNRFMQFCCSRHAYENCIYNSARYKCYKISAKFARDTARMLSEEKHFSNCRQYENLLCAATVTIAQQRLMILLFTLVLVTWKCCHTGAEFNF